MSLTKKDHQQEKALQTLGQFLNLKETLTNHLRQGIVPLIGLGEVVHLNI